MKKPILKKIKEVKQCHGIKWIDNYSWIHQENILEVLQDAKKLNKEVKNYLLAENKYTEHKLQNTNKLQKILFKEIKGRIKLENLSNLAKKQLALE